MSKKRKPRKLSDRLVERLYNMGVISTTNPIVHSFHGSRNGSWSWCVSSGTHDVGSTESMKTCLSWKRWVYSKSLHEIFEFHENDVLNMENKEKIEKKFLSLQRN